MKFGMVAIDEAEGCVLAHSIRVGGIAIKKGHVISRSDIAVLIAAGVGEVIAARLDTGDVAENVAARRIAAAIAGNGVSIAAAFTGRTNLHAAAHGVLTIDRQRLVALNSIDEGLTVATLHPHETVTPQQMVATVKIIPYALSEVVVRHAEELLAQPGSLLQVCPFTPHAAGLILTRVEGTRQSLIDKRVEVISARLRGLGSRVGDTVVAPHRDDAVNAALMRMAAAGLDPLLVFGASAIVDRGDVIPAAIVGAGGTVRHLGMPVDPGNLLLIGTIGLSTVIGVPSCASSPKTNGFDWVLARVLAGLSIGKAEIAEMAPGGLLTEILTRPQPRRG